MKNYERPSMETIIFTTQDVITASIVDAGNPGQIFPGKVSMKTWTDPDEGNDF